MTLINLVTSGLGDTGVGPYSQYENLEFQLTGPPVLLQLAMMHIIHTLWNHPLVTGCSSSFPSYVGYNLAPENQNTFAMFFGPRISAVCPVQIKPIANFHILQVFRTILHVRAAPSPRYNTMI